MALTQWFSRIARRRAGLVGLDISSSAVKLLELSEHNQQFRVESYAVEPLPQGAVVEKTIADVESVGEAIRRAVRRAGTKAGGAVVAVAGSAVITKVVTLPAGLSEEDVEAQIQVEADEYIPFPLDEVALDFEILGPKNDNPELMEVLIAACRQETVDTRVAAVELGGLEARIVDVEAFAMENAFALLAPQLPPEALDKAVAVVDVGATITTLHVIHKLRSIYTREQVFGGRQLTEEIQRRYGLSYDEAGRAKKQGGLPDDYYTEVLEPFKEAMVQQVSRALQFYFSSTHRPEPIAQVILAGGCAAIPGIDERVQKDLATPVMVANPFAAMSLAPKVDSRALADDAPAMMVACGLALRRFD